MRRARSQAASRRTEVDTWFATWSLLTDELRRLALPTLALAILFGIGGLALRTVMPVKYTSTADVLIDPRGFQVFKNDLTTGEYDANAAVNFVESQMHVMTSASVMARAIRYAAGETGTKADSAQATPASSTAIEQLQRSVAITRAERSYILSVSVRDADPVRAANLANAVVKAYIDADSENRTQAAARLTGDLTARLDQLRKRLADSETAAENYRQQNNLVSIDDRLVIDQQLADAVKALGAADERVSAVRASYAELSGAAPNAVLSTAGEADQALMAVLIARQTAAREEIARLSTRLGSQHPALRSARNQAAEVDGLVRSELERIRASRASELRKVTEERDNLAATVANLTERNEKARRSSIRLRTLEQQIASDRELLSSFETRAREAAEFGKIDSANIRVLSEAYPSLPKNGLGAGLPWMVAGVMLGIILGIGIAVLRALFRFAQSARRPQRQTWQDTPDVSPRRPASYARESLSRADRFYRADMN